MSDDERPSPGQLAGDEAGDTVGGDHDPTAPEDHSPGLVASLRRRLHLVKDDETEEGLGESEGVPDEASRPWGSGPMGRREEDPATAAFTSSDAAPQEPDASTADAASIESDPGWVFHEKDTDGGGYAGWLYHFADGDVVDQEGSPVDLAGSAAAPDDAAPEPEAATEPEPESEPGPEATDEPEPQPDAAAEPEAERETEPESAAAPEAEPEPVSESELGQEPDTQPDASAETADEAAEAAADAAADEEPEPAPPDERATEHEPDGARGPEPEAGPEAEPEAEPEAKPEAGPEAEPETEPNAAVDGDSRVQNWKASHRRGPAYEDLPAYVSYSSGTVLTAVLGGVILVAGLATVLALFAAITDATAGHWLRTAVLAVVALAAWAALVGWASSSVTVRNGVLEVAQGGRTETADLRDPAVSATSGPDPAARGWAVRVRRPEGRDLIVRGAQVKREQFARLVDYHQANPRDPSEPASGGRTGGSRR